MRSMAPHVRTGDPVMSKYKAAAVSHPLAVLIVVLVSYLMTVLNGSIVITALPNIRDDFGFTHASLSWVQNVYTLAFGGLLLLGARVGDILGRRRVYIAGMALFTMASFAIGFAPSASLLLCARIVQGIGAAVLVPTTLALLTTSFPEGPERTRALAYYGAAAGIGTSVGLVLGGIFAGWVSWRVGFFLNVPIGIVLMMIAARYLLETARCASRFDIAGSVYSTLGMSALVYGIVRSATFGWRDAETVAIFVAGIILLGLLVFNERSVRQPIMPLRLFAHRERAAAHAARIFYMGGMMGFWFFITLYLKDVFGFAPFEIGLAFLPMTIANFAGAMAVPWLTRRFGNARLLSGSVAVTTVGMAWLGSLSAATAYMTGIALPMVLIGFGQGGTLSPLTVSGMTEISVDDAGAASGLINAIHQLGGSLGLGILVAVFAAAGIDVHGGQAMFVQRVSTTLQASTAMIGLSFIIVLAIRRQSSPRSCR